MCHRGGFFIVSGEYNEAIEIFSKGLTAVKNNFLPPQVCVKGNVQTLKFYQVDMDDEGTCSQIHDQFQHCDVQRVFKTPLMVPEGYCSNDQYQFIITYNLALAYHLCALEQFDVEKLKVSLGLWEIIYRFHWNEDLGMATLHTCAILNNLGHVYRLLGDENTSKDCYESLLCALLCVQKASDTDGMEVCKAECFFQSITPLVLRDPKTASAA
jgi:hypothetical protein